jgi:hypothetical protein
MDARLPAPRPAPLAGAAACLLALASLAPAQGAARINLALGKPAKASSVEGQLTPNKAVDGPKSQASRWGSNYIADKNKDSAWIFVDLGKTYTVDSVAIYWEHSGAKRYDLQAWTAADTPSYSDEGWKTFFTDTALYYQPRPVDMCLSFLKVPPTALRYLRVRCYKRLFEFGFSIMELEVYGQEGATRIRVPSRTTSGRDARRVPARGWSAGYGSRIFAADGRAGAP